MTAELLLLTLALALYIILFVKWWQVIKMMADVESILNEVEFIANKVEFIADTVDYPKEGF